MSERENNRRIVKNTGLLYVRMLIVMCIQLYTSRVILKALGVIDFGIYGVVGGLVVLFSSLNTSLGSATSRFLTVEIGKNDKRQMKKVFSSAMVIHSFMAVVVVLLAEIIGLWFLNHKMEIPADRIQAANIVFQISIISCVFSITQIPYTSALIAHEHMSVYAYVGTFEAICNLLVAFLIWISPIDRLVWYAILILIVQIITRLIYRLYCKNHFEESHFCMHRDKGLYNRILHYSMYDTIGCLSVMAQGQGLNMVLNVFCGPVVNASRSIAYQVNAAVSRFSGNFMTAVRPQIIKYYAMGEEEKMMRLVKRSSVYTFLIFYLLMLPLCLETHYILKLWLGVVPDYSVSFVVIVLVNEMLIAFRRPRTLVNHATGYVKVPNLITGSILCMSLPLGYFFMFLGYSPNSVFLGMLMTTIVADVSNLFILKHYINYSIWEFVSTVHLKVFLMASLIAIIPFSLHLLLEESLIRVMIVFVTTLLFTCVVAWVIALDQHEKDIVQLFIRNKLCSR